MIALALLLAATPVTNPKQMTFTQDASNASRRAIADKLADIVSVKDAPFNAKGDGVTDDTAAIQACIVAVSVAAIDTTDNGQGEGRTCYLPRGVGTL